MNAARIDMGNFVIYVSNAINSSVNIFVNLNDSSRDSFDIKSNTCIVIVEEDKMHNINSILKHVLQILNSRGIVNVNKNINIVVNDVQELNSVQNIKSNDDFQFDIIKTYEKEKKEEKRNRKEDLFLAFWTSHIISVENNGMISKYLRRNGDEHTGSYMIDANSVSLTDMYYKFQELVKNPAYEKVFSSLNKEMKNEIVGNMVLDLIVSERHIERYYMENNSKRANVSEKAEVVSDLALDGPNDKLVNTETGIEDKSQLKVTDSGVSKYENDGSNSSYSYHYNPDVSDVDALDVPIDYNSLDTDNHLNDNSNVVELGDRDDDNKSISNDRSNTMIKRRVLSTKKNGINSSGLISIFEIVFILLLISLIVGVFALR